MKIGILTYHRAHNYGAILQAIATRVFLKKHGYNSYYVDYYPDYHRLLYVPFSIKEIVNRRFKGSCFYVLERLLYWSDLKLRYNNFISFIKSNILPFCKSVDEKYDIVIYGSDQIWRKQRLGIGYNPIYFGDNSINARMKIAYAASMGELPSCEDEKYLLSLYENFNSISVREESLKSFLEEKGLKNIYSCLDPTLLLDLEDWIPFIKPIAKKRDYVLWYNLQDSAFDEKQVRDFAGRIGCDLKIIYGGVKRKNSDMYDVVSGPGEFLSLIYNAKCVLSSSFHGVVFSIIFNKPFYASLVVNSNRVTDLLGSLNIDNCFIDGNNISQYSLPIIDFHYVNEKMKVLRAESEQYLLSQIADYTKVYQE